MVNLEESALYIKSHTLPMKVFSHFSPQSKIFGRTYSHSIRFVHKPHLICNLKRKLKVVGGEEDCLLLLSGESLKQLHYLHLAGIVKKGCRLIKEDHRCLLRKRLCNHN